MYITTTFILTFINTVIDTILRTTVISSMDIGMVESAKGNFKKLLTQNDYNYTSNNILHNNQHIIQYITVHICNDLHNSTSVYIRLFWV